MPTSTASITGSEKGDALTIPARNELLNELEIEKKSSHMFCNIRAQCTHVLPMYFCSIEPYGRCGGLDNNTDRSYIRLALKIGAEYLRAAVDLMVEAFRDTTEVRKGIDSKFSPRPARTVPRERRRHRS